VKVIETALPGVLIIEPKVFGDHRGFFLETFQLERYREAGIDLPFVQDNHSRSARGVLRGLHFQRTRPQGKLVSVSRGAVYDVAVDIDPASATSGQFVGVELNDDNHRQMWVPPGYAHGFCVLSEMADFQYKCTDFYVPADEGGLAWNDPDVGIPWPIEAPQLSAKDANNPRLRDLKPMSPPVGAAAAANSAVQTRTTRLPALLQQPPRFRKPCGAPPAANFFNGRLRACRRSYRGAETGERAVHVGAAAAAKGRAAGDDVAVRHAAFAPAGAPTGAARRVGRGAVCRSAASRERGLTERPARSPSPAGARRCRRGRRDRRACRAR